MTTKPPVEVIYAPVFTRAIKRLHKKFPKVAIELRPLIQQLENGETPGDQVQGTGYTVYKARVRNSQAQRGKSGGLRVIYYIKRAERVILVTIYSKTEQVDITADEIRRIIEEFESE